MVIVDKASGEGPTSDEPETPEPPKVEIVTEKQTELAEVAKSAVDALGLGDMDLPALLKEILGANEEDARWRKEVLRRLDILVNNQRLIHAELTDGKPIIKKAE